MRWWWSNEEGQNKKNVARTSAEISAYDKGKWMLKHSPNEDNIVNHFFELGLHEHSDHFTPTSLEQADHDNLSHILKDAHAAAAAHTHKHSHHIGKATAFNAKADASYYFKGITKNMEEKDQYFLFQELKTDFLEYLLIPFYLISCCNFTSYELNHTDQVQTFIVSLLVIVFLFYALCMWWLFQATEAFRNAPDEITTYIAENCGLPYLGSMSSYFTFRLVVYFISPLSLLALSVSSHIHQRVMLQRLTGIPHRLTDTYNSTSWWNNRAPILSTLIVMAVNVIFGAAAMAYDILFFQGLKEWERAATDSNKVCSGIIRGISPKDVGVPFSVNSTAPIWSSTASLSTSPPLPDIPIPLLMFNIIYTIWGVLYIVSACFFHRDLISDENVRVTADLLTNVEDRRFLMRESMADMKAKKGALHAGHVAQLFQNSKHLISTSLHPAAAP